MTHERTNAANSSAALLPAAAVLGRYQISGMTLWRWLQDEALEFPRPLIIQRRRYFYATELAGWERKRAGRRMA